MKDTLSKFIVAIKAFVYDKKRAGDILDMIETQPGAINAVNAVIHAIEQKVQIPPDVKPLVAANAYLIMVDMAMQVTGDKPDKAVMKQTMAAIVSGVR